MENYISAELRGKLCVSLLVYFYLQTCVLDSVEQKYNPCLCAKISPVWHECDWWANFSFPIIRLDTLNEMSSCIWWKLWKRIYSSTLIETVPMCPFRNILQCLFACACDICSGICRKVLQRNRILNRKRAVSALFPLPFKLLLTVPGEVCTLHLDESIKLAKTLFVW